MPGESGHRHGAWQISGSYLEACNCEAICPCRRIAGRPGGRSTYGECLGALSWIVEQGRAGDVDLADMGAVLAIRYHDDRPHRIEHADRTFAVTVRVVSRALPTM